MSLPMRKGNQDFGRLPRLAVGGLALFGLLASSCSGSSSAKADAIDTYAAGAHLTYKESFDSAKAMDTAIDMFVARPASDTLQAARQAWLNARDDYGLTEAYRFYGGPIDDEENGNEGLINAWPLDESYIDYVQGNPNTGVINNTSAYPSITKETLVELNEKDGETNISAGWHAIEFLLWGQDLSETGPGDRPVTDYTTASNAERRKTYLATASDLLLDHLSQLVEAWAPDADNYRASFVDLSNDEALRHIFTGIGELSRGELAGERMSVAFLDHSQEDEHSCFSDNTTSDIVANADGIRRIIEADYGTSIVGPGLADLVAKEDEDLAAILSDQSEEGVRLARAIPRPFDQHLRDGIADTDPGRIAVADAMKVFESQTDTIVQAADTLGVEIDVS